MSAKLGQTPSQTVGPYYSMRIGGEGQNIISVPAEGGDHIVVTGRVLDGDRKHIEDALIEFWQANPAGRYNHPDDARDLTLDPSFTGFARAMSNFATGVYELRTVKPGPVPDLEGSFQAPHISLILQARGMLNPLFTRLYFSDEEDANQDDLVLRRVPPARRHTLVAGLVSGSDPMTYHFDIKLQGDDETVFFDF